MPPIFQFSLSRFITWPEQILANTFKIPDCQPRKEAGRPGLDKKTENILIPQKQLIFLAVAAVKRLIESKAQTPHLMP